LLTAAEFCENQQKKWQKGFAKSVTVVTLSWPSFKVNSTLLLAVVSF